MTDNGPPDESGGGERSGGDASPPAVERSATALVERRPLVLAPGVVRRRGPLHERHTMSLNPIEQVGFKLGYRSSVSTGSGTTTARSASSSSAWARRPAVHAHAAPPRQAIAPMKIGARAFHASASQPRNGGEPVAGVRHQLAEEEQAEIADPEGRERPCRKIASPAHGSNLEVDVHVKHGYFASS